LESKLLNGAPHAVIGSTLGLSHVQSQLLKSTLQRPPFITDSMLPQIRNRSQTDGVIHEWRVLKVLYVTIVL
jgi:hypothetical protein